MAKRITKSKPAETAAPTVPEQVTVDLGTDLRIGTAREIYDRLDAAAGSGIKVVVDAGAISRVDAAGLQTLLAALVRFRTLGAVWHWHNPSPALVSAAHLLGLHGALELT